VPERVASLHFSAVSGIVQERAAGLPRSVEGPFIDFLVDAYPSSVPAPTRSRSWRAAASAPTRRARCSCAACSRRRRSPLRAAAVGGARGSAPARVACLARRCAREGSVTSLHTRRSASTIRRSRAAHRLRRHARPRRARAGRIATLPDALEIVGHYLERFALAGLLEA
jgi:hypothetical protein